MRVFDPNSSLQKSREAYGVGVGLHPTHPLIMKVGGKQNLFIQYSKERGGGGGLMIADLHSNLSSALECGMGETPYYTVQ